MKIIAMKNIIVGFLSFFFMLAIATFLNNIIWPFFGLFTTHSFLYWTLLAGYLMILALILIFVPIIITIGPENLPGVQDKLKNLGGQ